VLRVGRGKDEHGVLVMVRVGRGDVDDFDVGVGGEGGVGVVWRAIDGGL
jgi:hypothetical protein